MKLKKGFTLIELLVVIAIISLLASVALASLGSARAKANNAAVKSDMRGILTQANIYREDHGVFFSEAEEGCTSQGTPDMYEDANIIRAFANIAGNSDATSRLPFSGNPLCERRAPDEWRITTKLRAAEGTTILWCVDSTGVSKGLTTEFNAGTTCGGNPTAACVCP